jgi:HK97 family phage prohead protease
MANICKQYIAKTEVDSEERTVTAVISTSGVDRDSEVVLPKGGNFENYLKNPVVLWAHDYSDTPVGKTLWLKAVRDKITAKVQFAETDKAEEVYQLFKGGFLNAFSISFMPAEDGSHPPTPKEIEKHPEWASARRIYDKWELLEYSPVPVPANPEALATAIKSKGISLSEETLEELGIDEEKVFVPEEKKEPEDKPKIKTSPLITTFSHIPTSHLRMANPEDVAKKMATRVIKKVRGKMY